METIREAQNRVVIGLDNGPARRLSPGASVKARIEVEHREGRLLAPNEALRYAQDKCTQEGAVHCASRLWVLRDGAPVAVSVALGSSDGKRTEIVGGELKAEDTLILGERD